MARWSLNVVITVQIDAIHIWVVWRKDAPIGSIIIKNATCMTCESANSNIKYVAPIKLDKSICFKNLVLEWLCLELE